MKKFSVLLYGTSLLGLSVYGLMNQSYYMQIFLNLSTPFVVARIILIVALLAYAFVPAVRIYTARNLLGLGGMILLSFGLVSIFSPSLLGNITGYVLIGDTLSFIEGGVLASLLSMELPARRSSYLAGALSRVQSVLKPRETKLTYLPAHHTKTFKNLAETY